MLCLGILIAPSSEGCNHLIKNNLAILLQDFKQITEELKPIAYYDEKIIQKKIIKRRKKGVIIFLDNQPVTCR